MLNSYKIVQLSVLVLLPLSLLACGGGGGSGADSNDVPVSGSSRLSSSSESFEQVDGSRAYYNDHSFRVPRSMRVVFEMRSSDFDSIAGIINSDRELVCADDDDGVGTNAYGVCDLPEGTYRLRCRAYGAGLIPGSYSWDVYEFGRSSSLGAKQEVDSSIKKTIQETAAAFGTR